MPIESVAAYINNTFTLVIFILVCTILFFIILALSSYLKKRVSGRNRGLSYRETDVPKGGKSFTGADPYRKSRDALLGMTFILVSLTLILLMASYYFSMNMVMGMTVFIISFLVLSIIIVLVYMSRSGVYDK